MTRVVDVSWLFCASISNGRLETAPNLWRLQHRGGVLTPSVAGWINVSIGFFNLEGTFLDVFFGFLVFLGASSLTSFTGERDLSPVIKHLSFHLWQVALAYWSGSSKAVSSSNLEADQEIDGRFAGCFFFGFFGMERRVNPTFLQKNPEKSSQIDVNKLFTYIYDIYVYASGLETVRVKWHILKVLRNGLLRYILNTCPNL